MLSLEKAGANQKFLEGGGNKKIISKQIDFLSSPKAL